MRTFIHAGAALSALAAAGCVSASGETQQALTPELAEGGYVQEVYVSAPEGAGVSAAFAERIADELEEELADCATGDRPLRLDVMINDTDLSNPVLAAVITDTNEIEGHVRVYSLETGEAVGDYDIAWKNRGGLGAGGAFMQLSMAQTQMTGGFAGEICRRIFEGGDPDMETVQVVPF